MHLRKLVPLSDLLSGSGNVARSPPAAAARQCPKPRCQGCLTCQAVPKVAPLGTKPAPGTQAPRCTSGTLGTPGTSGTAGTDSAFKDRFLSGTQVRRSRPSTTWCRVRVSHRRVAGRYRRSCSFRTRKTRRASARSRRRGCSRSPRKLPGSPCRSSIAVADAGSRPPRRASRLAEHLPSVGARRPGQKPRPTTEGGSDGEFHGAGRARDLPGRQDHDRREIDTMGHPEHDEAGAGDAGAPAARDVGAVRARPPPAAAWSP